MGTLTSRKESSGVALAIMIARSLQLLYMVLVSTSSISPHADVDDCPPLQVFRRLNVLQKIVLSPECVWSGSLAQANCVRR